MSTKTIYVRVQPNKQGVTSFFRCGMLFILSWRTLHDVDAATVKRLEAEQMLEVTETRPPELDEAAPAGDSAAGNVETQPVESNAPASALTSENLATAMAEFSVATANTAPEALSVSGVASVATLETSGAATTSTASTATQEPAATVTSDATKPADPAAVIDAVKAVIAQLDPANTDLYTAAGKPKTDALAALTGWPVTAAERDAALGE